MPGLGFQFPWLAAPGYASSWGHIPTPSSNTDWFTHTHGHLKQLESQVPSSSWPGISGPSSSQHSDPWSFQYHRHTNIWLFSFLAYFPADGIWCLLVFTYVDIHIHAHCAHLTVFAGAGNRDAWTPMVPGPTLVAVRTPAHRTGSPLLSKIARKEV